MHTTRSIFTHLTLPALVLALMFSGPAPTAVVSAPLVTVSVPNAIGFEGFLADFSGNPVADGDYTLTFKLYSVADGGTALNTEVLTDTQVIQGLYAVTLETFVASDFAGDRWFGVTVGGGSEIEPRTRVLAVPYALNAQTAGSADTADAVAWSGITGMPAGFADGVDNDLLGGLSCSNNQVAKWNGAAWACAADANSGGTITGVTAGTGLTGGGSSGSVTLNVNTSTIQQRVSSTCDTGSAIRIISSSGGVTCQASVTGSGATNRIAFWGSSSALSSNSGLTVSGNNMTVAGGLNVGSATGATTGQVRANSSFVAGSPGGTAGTGDFRAAGNVVYEGALISRQSGVETAVYGYTFLHSGGSPVNPIKLQDTGGTLWDATGSRATGTYTFNVTTSQSINVPAGVKAVAVAIGGYWTSAGSGNYMVARTPTFSDGGAVARAYAANIFSDGFGIVAVNGSGEFQIVVGGATVQAPYVSLVGYFR